MALRSEACTSERHGHGHDWHGTPWYTMTVMTMLVLISSKIQLRKELGGSFIWNMERYAGDPLEVSVQYLCNTKHGKFQHARTTSAVWKFLCVAY